jgi:hypothetical protein
MQAGEEEEAVRSQRRVRSEVDRIVRGDGARVGFVLDGAGRVAAAAGNPGDLDPVSFAALAAAHAWAAQDLAPIAAGVEFSQLFQEGRSTTVVLSALAGDRVLALLYDHVGTGAGDDPWKMPDLGELARAVVAMDESAARAGTSSKGAGGEWVEAAEDQIDRIFRGEG